VSPDDDEWWGRDEQVRVKALPTSAAAGAAEPAARTTTALGGARSPDGGESGVRAERKGASRFF